MWRGVRGSGGQNGVQWRSRAARAEWAPWCTYNMKKAHVPMAIYCIWPEMKDCPDCCRKYCKNKYIYTYIPYIWSTFCTFKNTFAPFLDSRSLQFAIGGLLQVCNSLIHISRESASGSRWRGRLGPGGTQEWSRNLPEPFNSLCFFNSHSEGSRAFSVRTWFCTCKIVLHTSLYT